MPKAKQPQVAETNDLRSYQRAALTVDLALLTIIRGALHVLLIRRRAEPYAEMWSLPGGFLRIDESLDEASARVLRDKVGIGEVFFEQLYTFGAINRDPRDRVITVAYYALVDEARLVAILKAGTDLALFEVIVPHDGGAAEICSQDGEIEPLAFDHADILAVAVKRLRGKLDYSPVGFELLPGTFTLRQLQDVHEAILGQRLNKPAFRRRMLDKNVLHATGERETGTTYRPAELYRFIQQP